MKQVWTYDSVRFYIAANNLDTYICSVGCTYLEARRHGDARRWEHFHRIWCLIFLGITVAAEQQFFPPVLTSTNSVISILSLSMWCWSLCVSAPRNAEHVYFSEQRSCVQRQRLLTRSSAIAEGPRDASCQLKSCQLSCNSAETTCTTSPEEIEVMNLQRYGGPMCNQRVHSTMTRSRRFRCPVGVINKPPTNELWLSPVHRRLEVGGVAQW